MKTQDNIRMPKGRVSVYKENVLVKTQDNITTDEIAEFFTGWLARDSDYKVTHMYGQWGSQANFPPGTGPFITPVRANQVADLTSATISTTDAEIPITHYTRATQAGQSEFANNILSFICAFPNNDNQVYIGAGLVCELATTNLLLGHVAFDGILKEAAYNIVVVWDWIFSNS